MPRASPQQTTVETTTDDTFTDELNLGDVRQLVDIKVNTAGAANLTIEVSTDGSDWDEVRTIEYGEAVTNLEQFSFAVQFVRAKVDQNLTELTLTSRGR